ncbi:hypothetical protein [Alicyclobacillus sp.]|uniref:hypothetical protein n=1 Tax=Alicyclobacillus sp. TaxID=61169 RepID=UPI0025BADB3B|nr:hypothetical protein [Alicyclobacillus sp.]MCL6515472.1 hypothetical protein [Alicyclobacillus sp.]
MELGRSLPVYEIRSGRRLRPSSGWVTVLSGASGVAAVWLADHFGLWYAGVVAGAVLGLGLRGASRVAGAAVLAGFFGWLLPLGLRAVAGQPVGRLAERVAGILGMGGGAVSGAATLFFTGILGALLCLCGAWLGAAIRRIWG